MWRLRRKPSDITKAEEERRQPVRPFDLVDLNLFVAVAEAGNITRAASRMGLALASASARISDPWAERQLAIATRARHALPKAARQLVDHLRTAARA